MTPELRARAAHVLPLPLLLAFILLCGTAVPAQAQGKGSSSKSCQDIPLIVVIDPVPFDLHAFGFPDSTGYPGIYGDARDVSGNPAQSVYEDGLQGVYAKFQICNGNDDFYFNLPTLKPTRFFIVDFSRLLVPGDVAGPYRAEKRVAHERRQDGGLDPLLAPRCERAAAVRYLAGGHHFFGGYVHVLQQRRIRRGLRRSAWGAREHAQRHLGGAGYSRRRLFFLDDRAAPTPFRKFC